MKIFGDEASTEFKNFNKEPGEFYGSQDVLIGKRGTINGFTISMFGRSDYSKSVKPILYLHIPTNAWSTFTGKLREYFLPWRWKTAYLDAEDGTPVRRILVCTSVYDGKMSEHLSHLIGKSWFLVNLINKNSYKVVFGQEFLLVHTQAYTAVKIVHPLGQWVGEYGVHGTKDLYCHIYRPRSLYSTIRYEFLKRFSSSWKEVSINIAQISEKVLIKKTDEAVISGSGLI